MVEIVFRPRVSEWLLLEVGFLTAVGGGFAGNASFGVIAELGGRTSPQPYLALGGTVAGGCGESEEGAGCSGAVFGHSRLGLGFALGDEPSNLLTLDAGGWLGGVSDDNNELEPFATPIAGVGYFW